MSHANEHEKWEKGEVDEEVFLSVLKEAIEIVESSGTPYVLIGGIASSVWGRPRPTQDIDFFVRPEDAEATLEAFAQAGFDTWKKEEHWLYKAVKNDMLVDIIFRSQGDIYLDEEMVQRATIKQFKGQSVKVIGPEDLLLMKAVVHGEEVPHQWHDAVAIVGRAELEWDYVIKRAQLGARRVLSLLIYAQSNGLLVPDDAVRRLFKMIYES